MVGKKKNTRVSVISGTISKKYIHMELYKKMRELVNPTFEERMDKSFQNFRFKKLREPYVI